MTRLLSRIGRADGFSWPVVALLTPLSITITLLGPWSAYGGPVLAWVGIAVAAEGLALLTVAPLRLTLLGPGPRPSRPGITLAAFAAAGLVRAVSIGQLGHHCGLMPGTELVARSIGGPFAGIFYCCLAAGVVSSARERAQRVSELALEQERLIAATRSAPGEVRRVSDRISEMVEAQLVGGMRELAVDVVAPGRDAGALDARIEELVDRHLKPLSRSIARSGPVEVPRPDRREPGQGSVTDLLVDAASTQDVHAGTTTLVIASGLAASTLVSFAPDVGLVDEVLGLVAAITAFGVTLDAASRALGRVGAKMGVAVRAVLVTLAFSGSAALAAFVALAWWGRLEGAIEGRVAFSYIVIPVTAAPLVGWAMMVSRAWQRQSDEVDARLEAVNAQLREAVESTRQRIEAERVRLSRLVHGPVQDRLLAARIRLADGDALPDGRKQAAELISDAIALLSAPAAVPRPLADTVADFAELWGPSIAIESLIDREASDVLSLDPSAAELVGELVREAIANAVRHSGVRRVTVALSVPSAGRLDLVVEGDGVPDQVGADGPESRRRGIGSTLFDEGTLSWNLDITQRGTCLTAAIPLRPVPAA